MSVTARAGDRGVSVRVDLGIAGTFAAGLVVSGAALYLPPAAISDPLLDSFFRSMLLFIGALASAVSGLDYFLRFKAVQGRVRYHGQAFAEGWLFVVVALSVGCLAGAAHDLFQLGSGPTPLLVWGAGFAGGALGRGLVSWSRLSY